ncbi:hypothetical protein HPB48_001186 [Haemaphysalis longicornis]|uniref:Uncharacterized protein n=1 Tax=Haemaphysalis longicornis TaxID=44386 RepID=A0A9J6FI76_HAELO|nr:hypothetical protein HPB48_001186 [Haemaphysalis longicornis]
MEAEPAGSNLGGPSLGCATSRKQDCFPSDARRGETELRSSGGDGCLKEKPTRRLLTALSFDSSFLNTARRVHTVLFMPESPKDDLRILNRQAISVFLEASLPGEVKEVRINSLNNVLAIDVKRPTSVETLRQFTMLGEIKVHAYIPPDEDTAVGVIYDVDVSIPDDDLPVLIRPATDGSVIKQVSRLGKSRCVKLVFQGDCIPPYVKVGLFRHEVQPFVTRLLQRPECLTASHVSGACGSATVRSKYSRPPFAEDCSARGLKCLDFQNSQDSPSETCSFPTTEPMELQPIVRDTSFHKDTAAKASRRRHYRRRRPSSNVTVSVVQEPSAENFKAPKQLRPSPLPAATPLPPPPPPLPPVVPTSSDATFPTSPGKVKEATKSSQPVDERPGLPAPQPVDPLPADATPQEGPIVTDSNDVLEIIAVLRSIIHAVRTLINTMDRPAVPSAVEVLDALDSELSILEWLCDAGDTIILQGSTPSLNF